MAIGKKKSPLQNEVKSFQKFQMALKPVAKKQTMPQKKGK